MYPQQQQHHLVPVTNLQQPYYSANPYLIPYPHTSDSAIHPPGTDPPGNSTSLSVPDAQTTDSQYWVVAEPIRYDLVSPLFDQSFQIYKQNQIFLMLCHLGFSPTLQCFLSFCLLMFFLHFFSNYYCFYVSCLIKKAFA